jgi:hypothetical protein
MEEGARTNKKEKREKEKQKRTLKRGEERKGKTNYIGGTKWINDEKEKRENMGTEGTIQEKRTKDKERKWRKPTNTWSG